MKNNIKRAFLILLLSQVSIISWAEENKCDSKIHQVMKDKINETSLIAESCKIWSYKPNITIAVFAYPLDDEDPDEYSTKKITIALIDNIKNNIVNIYNQNVEEDAVEKIGSDSFTIDTAKYQLADNTRAFGIRFQTTLSGPSCANYLFEDRQTLYVPEQRTLRPVLNLYMHKVQAISGCIGSATNNETLDDANLAISIEKTKSNDFYDLKVIAHIQPDTDMENPPSSMNMKPRIETYKLHYNGKKYVGSDKNTPWWIVTVLDLL